MAAELPRRGWCDSPGSQRRPPASFMLSGVRVGAGKTASRWELFSGKRFLPAPAKGVGRRAAAGLPLDLTRQHITQSTTDQGLVHRPLGAALSWRARGLVFSGATRSGAAGSRKPSSGRCATRHGWSGIPGMGKPTTRWRCVWCWPRCSGWSTKGSRSRTFWKRYVSCWSTREPCSMARPGGMLRSGRMCAYVYYVKSCILIEPRPPTTRLSRNALAPTSCPLYPGPAGTAELESSKKFNNRRLQSIPEPLLNFGPKNFRFLSNNRSDNLRVSLSIPFSKLYLFRKYE